MAITKPFKKGDLVKFLITDLEDCRFKGDIVKVLWASKTYVIIEDSQYSWDINCFELANSENKQCTFL